MGTASPQLSADRAELRVLDRRIRALLPEEYACYASVSPVSMGSAGLKYGPDGKVAWNQIWTHFCDLALAGGPPHRGKMLTPVPIDEVRACPKEYDAVAAEAARGIFLVTGLPVLPHVAPGWIGVVCGDEEMAAWLHRAVMVENVFARRARQLLHLPAGPRFRVAKEIKNLVTALAKTHHYWADHSSEKERDNATTLVNADLIEPATPEEAHARPAEYEAVVAHVEAALTPAGWTLSRREPGWLGFLCESVEQAVWLMRALIVDQVLARREEQTLFVPVAPGLLENGKVDRLIAACAKSQRLWQARQRQ